MDRPANTPFELVHLREAIEMVRALAHPLRMRILALLGSHAAVNVHTIYTTLGIEQAIASQHLRILREARLVQTKRQGKEIFYLLDEQHLSKVLQVAGELAKMIPAK